MTPERERFLNLREKPARLLAEEVSHFLNCSPHDVPVLVAYGMLKPLGRPADNSVKYFATATIRELMEDVKWLAKADATTKAHWVMKNARAKENKEQFSTPSAADNSGKSAMQRA
jgi:hypothetical protein